MSFGVCFLCFHSFVGERVYTMSVKIYPYKLVEVALYMYIASGGKGGKLLLPLVAYMMLQSMKSL